jgi:glucose/arabinose dehydrogenase
MRTLQRTGFLSLAFLAAAHLPSVVAPVEAATTCYNVLCSTPCSPTPPAAVSTVISGFPAGADIPIAFVDPADNLPHRFVATQEGFVFAWDGVTHALLPTPFLNLSPTGLNKVNFDGGERGLLAMAVEPDYRTSGRFYVFYTRLADGDIVVERYQRLAGNPNRADDASGTVILRIDHPAGNHNGGQLAFGPDGYLYISTGDGGGSCDGGGGASGDGQNPATLAGKLLRIDVRNVDPTPSPSECGLDASYTVPSDNPFAGQPSSCNEVWGLGLRNPFRFTFDRETGDIYVGDVGQNKWEEINLKRASTPAPVNFGWVCREGCETAGNDESSCGTAGCPVDPGTTCEFPRASTFWDPILCHYNGGWDSIMGGYRYRGERVPVNAGRYFYGDAACGQVWATTTLDPANPAAIAASCWENGLNPIYGFGEDHLGEIYVVRGWAGTVDCIHNGDGCWWAGWGGLFEDDFESEGLTHWSEVEPPLP